MGEMIGRGKETLVNKVKACENAGGSPVIRTGFSGKKYSNKIIFACYGAGEEVKGGTITGLETSTVRSIRKAQKGAETLETEEALDILE